MANWDDHVQRLTDLAKAKGVTGEDYNDVYAHHAADDGSNLDAIFADESARIDRRAASNGGPGGMAPGGGAGAAPQTPTPTSAWGQQASGFYDQLMQRAGQSLDVHRTDPAIRGQADAFSADQERARRGYLNDLAEREGPTANLLGEQRLTAEKAGQASGQFEAQLMGREVSARRDEIAQALQLGAGQLSDQQRLDLTRQLGLLDAQLRGRGYDIQQQGLAQDQDQFMRQLALRQWDLGDQSDYRWQALGA
jgi:hypothetical protein